MPTYVYLCHSSDMLMPHETESSYWIPWVLKVPPRCTFASISETGQNAALLYTFRQNKLSSNKKTKEIMINPEENYEELSILMAGDTNDNIASDNNFHFKKAGQSYTNREIDFFMYFNIKGENIAYRSGLYDIEEEIHPPLPTSSDDAIVIPTEGIPSEQIEKIYKGSIFPTAENVISKIKSLFPEKVLYTLEDIKDAVYFLGKDITQSDLFKRFPGNHYNFGCRSYDSTKPVKPEHLKLARNRSRESLLPRPRFNSLVQSVKRGKTFIRLHDDGYDLKRILSFGEKLKHGESLNPAQKKAVHELFVRLKAEVLSGEFLVSDIPKPYKEYVDLLIKAGVSNVNLYTGGRRTTKRRRRNDRRSTRRIVSRILSK